MSFLKVDKRTHYCGELRGIHEGQTVVLMGWVNSRRDHGGLIFIDLRDREGIVQVMFDPNQKTLETAKNLRGEYVVAVKGKVKKRPEGMRNEKVSTGEVEIIAESFSILSQANTPPFEVDNKNVSEAVRLKYRYLDLRSASLQKNIRLRHKVTTLVRNFLDESGFLEVETPILYKSTPEGARDYLVPSRVNPGTFYALPQSPQTLKQLLMISGFDKYYQIARCFRDEDLRAERQPEFSQIDLELSFVDADDVMAVSTELFKKIWKQFRGVEVKEIPVFKYKDMMDLYGSDKPDLRNPLKIVDVSEQFRGVEFNVFKDTLARGGFIRGVGLETKEEISRGTLDKWTTLAKQYHAKGMIWIKFDGKQYSSPVNKFLSESQLASAYEKIVGAKQIGIALIVSDDYSIVSSSLGALRLELGKHFSVVDLTQDKFCWVTDFPLLEYDSENKRWAACHHPFTMPKDEDIELLKSGESKSLAKVRAKAYDLVCNGIELGGGSIRIHNQEIQTAMFKALGLTEEQAKEKFGYFVEALGYGTPPHGGIAWGLDRLIMILAGTEAIRDVIAFPKTARAVCLMSETPSTVDKHQLLELGIRVNPSLENQKA